MYNKYNNNNSISKASTIATYTNAATVNVAATVAAAATVNTNSAAIAINNNNHSNNNDSTYTAATLTTAISGHHKRKHNIKREPLPLFLLIMRLNLKAVLLCLIIAVVIITCAVYICCSDFSFPHDRRLYEVSDAGNELFADGANDASGGAINGNGVAASRKSTLKTIECLINQEYSIGCRRDIETNEVYVPFSFLRNYFDISGSLSTPSPVSNTPDAAAAAGVGGGGGAEKSTSDGSKFVWMHSNAKINIPKGKYDARGVFTYFENYNVEVRDRVKCISAVEGVPVSIQWEKRGYFYPTQIAQFALAHYSKNLTEPAPRRKVLEDADANQMDWTTPKASNITRIWHPRFYTTVVRYETAIGYDSAISAQLDATQPLDLVLSVDLLLVTNGSSLMVTVESRDTQQTYHLHYIPANLLLSTQGDNIYYGLGSAAVNKWRRLTRDLLIDAQKGLAASNTGEGGRKAVAAAAAASKTKLRRTELRVVSISFLGVGFYDNLTLSTTAHMAHFYDAAEWFVHNQDAKTGGWPNPVKRNLNGFAELKAGWLSAMGQGHGISVLARAYWHSGGDKRYLTAAALALKPYRVLSRDGGVLAQFMEKYNWYEEYPTRPASFVLNGFIYSLLGLYDLNATAPAGIAREAGKLFSQGMYSLKKMLLLYDTGSGTSYDLRHLSLGVAPNLARWDYHATHVNQLLLLATIDSDPIIAQTAERWKGYMFGKRAKHN